MPCFLPNAVSIVFSLIQVLAAIHLNDDFQARGAEIHDVRADGMLATEMDTSEVVAAQ